MTLLIALMLNYLVSHITGTEYIASGWIVALWGLHFLFHAMKRD